MPYYSDDIVEEVRNKTDIVDVISQYVNLQKKGSQYFGLCPFHNEKTGSFSVSPHLDYFVVANTVVYPIATQGCNSLSLRDESQPKPLALSPVIGLKMTCNLNLSYEK